MAMREGVNKVAVRKELKRLNAMREELVEFRKTLKKRRLDVYHWEFRKLLKVLEEIPDELDRKICYLEKQLVCKHDGARREELFENYHNGDDKTYVYCDNCNHLLEVK